jgi:hypothetical protein
MRRGLAIQIDEYVPTTLPNISARVNPFKLLGPQINNATRTIITVREVKRERRIVSWIDLSMISGNQSFF